MVNMLVGAQDAVGGLKLFSPNKTPAYFEASKCEYPPNRTDLRNSVYYPHSNHDIAQTSQLVMLDPKAYGLPYMPEMQIFYGTNRPVAASDSWKQFEGLTKTFNVVIDVVMSESAYYADIVLPDRTYLESWHFAATRGTPMTSHIAIRQPMTNPYNIEHDAYSIFWELMKGLGLTDKYLSELNASWGLKEVTFKPGRSYNAREACEVIWADKTKKDFAYATEHGFVGSKLSVKSRYLSGVEAEFKGPGKNKLKFYRDQLIATYEKVEATVKKNNITNIDLAKYKIALSPIPTRDHAFPTPHREAKDYPFYIVTHKRMYRNQSAFTANNVILNQALGPDAATKLRDDQPAYRQRARHQGRRYGDDRNAHRQGQGNGQAHSGRPSGYDCRVLPLRHFQPGSLGCSTQGHFHQPGPRVALGHRFGNVFLQRYQMQTL